MATTRRLIGNIKGPKGDTGATGATGAQGPAGQDGAPGVNDYATTEAAGLVRVGDDFNINSSNGTLSIKNAFTRASALAKTVTGEAFATSLGKIAKAVDWVVDNAPNFFNKSTDIVDGFTSSLTTKALSANAGKTLKTSIDSLNDSFANIELTQPTLSSTNVTLANSASATVYEAQLDPGLYLLGMRGNIMTGSADTQVTAAIRSTEVVSTAAFGSQTYLYNGRGYAFMHTVPYKLSASTKFYFMVGAAYASGDTTVGNLGVMIMRLK